MNTSKMGHHLKTLISVCAGVFLGGILVVTYVVAVGPIGQRGENVSSRDEGSAEQEIATIRNDLDALRGKVEARPSVVERVIQVEAQADSTEADSVGSSGEQPSELEHQHKEQTRLHVHAVFADQEIDPSWAGQKEVSISEFARESGFNLLDAECRTTLCRVELAPGDEKSHQELLGSLSDEASPWSSSGRMIFEPGEDGTPRKAQLYFAREGEEFARTLNQFWRSD